MLTAQLAGDKTHHPKPYRTPLRPTNILSTRPTTNHSNKKTNFHRPIDDTNKENPDRMIPIEPLIDSSLAEELSEIRKKMERLRVERERTEGMMRERGMVMEKKMEEMRERGEVQKLLEMEVDRLFRIKEIQSLCKRSSPIRSLREKEQGGKIKVGQPQEINSESTSECISGSQVQSSSSETHTEN